MELSNNIFSNDLFDNGNEFLKLQDISDFGRESLGILKLDELNASLSDCGRESLGILQLDMLNLSLQNSANTFNSPLNMAFRYSNLHSRQFPSTSTNSGDLSFHSESLNGLEISKIYSLQSSKFTSPVNSTLNDAFASSGSLLRKVSQSCRESNCANDIQIRSRLQSLPQFPYNHTSGNDNGEEIRKCLSEENLKVVEGNLIDIDEDVPRNVLVLQDRGLGFEDLVSIEASHIAMKLESICLNESNDDLFNIDKTTPPKELELEEVVEDVPPKIDVFKAIDRMVPPKTEINMPFLNGTEIPNEQCSEHEIQSCDHSLPEAIKRTPTNKNKIIIESHSLPKKRRSCIQERELQNATKQIELTKKITRSLSDTHITSSPALKNNDLKNVKGILFNLSNIILNELEDVKQKEEAQNLLSSIANILLSDNSEDNCKESSNSSSDRSSEEKKHLKDTQDQNKVMNLQKKSAEGNGVGEMVEALDLTVKSERKVTGNCPLPNSKTSLPKVLRNTKISKPESNTDGIKDVKKLKPKKVESGIKKGPLKAMIPVGNMAKTNGSNNRFMQMTPIKNKSQSTQMLNKKTSTPISEQLMRPVAQSTPEINCANSDNLSSESLMLAKKRKSEFPISPLGRPASLTELSSMFNNNRQSNSGSVSSLSDSSPKPLRKVSSSTEQAKMLLRRHSATELQNVNKTNLRNNSSLGREMKAGPSLLTKMKQDIASSRYSLESNSFKSTMRTDLRLGNNNGGHLKERNKALVNAKPTNLITKLMNRKQGKENKN